ncbi:MAG: glycosyl hydrolase [Rhodothermales bacterium]
MKSNPFRSFWLILVLVALCAAPPAEAQRRSSRAAEANVHAPTPAGERLAARDARQALEASSLVNNVAFRNIGPTVMSGRVVDLDVDPSDGTRFYVAYASGGLWRTDNNGASFEPLFDDQPTMTIGDIAVDWQRGVIWVGTGEKNASRSSYAGTGIYRSDDGGKTWTHRGLAETHRIGRIVLHPTDPNTLWVAASGHLYSPNAERGVYRSDDGGATWTRTLFIDDTTGAIDLAVDPGNPEVLYAAMWHRTRSAWDFVEGGATSGIYKSIDGGKTWTLASGAGSGFPGGEGIGRIGLAVYPDNPRIVYAVVDNQTRRPADEEAEAEAEAGLTRDALRDMSRDAFLELEADSVDAYLRDNGFPERYTGESVLEEVRDGVYLPRALVEYLEDANAQLFDTDVTGAEVYRSDDAGASWRRTHDAYIDDLFYTYGYYFGEIRVAPHDADRIYVLGVPLIASSDGGKTFEAIHGDNVHSDHQALWVSPTRPGHLLNGNDGGVNISFDDGKNWVNANTPAVGQFYAITVDDARPYNVYGGLQDNGVWVGPSTYEASLRWRMRGEYPYKSLLGGDGMQVQVDTRTNDIVYTGSQFGFYSRIERSTGKRARLRPTHVLGERPLRFNWQTPILLSRHNQDILYMGSNKLHRSLNQGDDWTTISGDLTLGGKPGDVPYGTLTTIDESPLQFGLLYTGSDDGLVYRSPDGGVTWTRISDGLPQGLWVSRVEASHHDKNRVYVSLNGYRYDDFTPYVYRSDDAGATWRRLGSALPAEAVNVVLEDAVNPDLLYVGTDHSLYVSLDGGATFMAMNRGIPHAPVHDLAVQEREQELVVGTHGRSLYVGSLAHIRQLREPLLEEEVHLFAVEGVTASDRWGQSFSMWSEPSEPEIRLGYYSREAGPATIRILGEADEELAVLRDEAEAGLNYPVYDASIAPETVERWAREAPSEGEERPTASDNGKTYLPAGTYTVEVARAGATARGSLKIAAPNARTSGR